MEEEKKEVSWDPLARSASGKQYLLDKLDKWNEKYRYPAKKINKNAIRVNPSLGPTQVPWNGSTAEEYIWPSQNPDYIQSPAEKRNAQDEASYETDLRGKWNITKVKDDGSKAILCNQTTGVCIIVALAAGALAKLAGVIGGKTKRKKIRRRKTRRHHKK